MIYNNINNIYYYCYYIILLLLFIGLVNPLKTPQPVWIDNIIETCLAMKNSKFIKYDIKKWYMI